MHFIMLLHNASDSICLALFKAGIRLKPINILQWSNEEEYQSLELWVMESNGTADQQLYNACSIQIYRS